MTNKGQLVETYWLLANKHKTLREDHARLREINTELLEALKEFVRAWRNGQLLNEMEDAIVAAHAAIAKAEGR